MSNAWRLDELAHAGPEHLDPSFVAGYDRKQGWPDPGPDLAAFEIVSAEYRGRLYGAYTCVYRRASEDLGALPH